MRTPRLQHRYAAFVVFANGLAGWVLIERTSFQIYRKGMRHEMFRLPTLSQKLGEGRPILLIFGNYRHVRWSLTIRQDVPFKNRGTGMPLCSQEVLVKPERSINLDLTEVTNMLVLKRNRVYATALVDAPLRRNGTQCELLLYIDSILEAGVRLSMSFTAT